MPAPKTIEDIKKAEDSKKLQLAILFFYQKIIQFRRFLKTNWFDLERAFYDIDRNKNEWEDKLKSDFENIIKYITNDITISIEDTHINKFIIPDEQDTQNPKFLTPVRQIALTIFKLIHADKSGALPDDKERSYTKLETYLDYFDPYYVSYHSNAGGIGDNILGKVDSLLMQETSADQDLIHLYDYYCQQLDLAYVNEYSGMKQTRLALKNVIKQFEATVTKKAEIDQDPIAKNMLGYIALKKLKELKTQDIYVSNCDYYNEFSNNYNTVYKNKYQTINEICNLSLTDVSKITKKLNDLQIHNQKINRYNTILQSMNPDVFKQTHYYGVQLESKALHKLENYLSEIPHGKHDIKRTSQVTNFFKTISDRKIHSEKQHNTAGITKALKTLKQELFNEDKNDKSSIFPHACNSKLNKLATSSLKKIIIRESLGIKQQNIEVTKEENLQMQDQNQHQLRRELKTEYKEAMKLDDKWMNWLQRLWNMLCGDDPQPDQQVKFN